MYFLLSWMFFLLNLALRVSQKFSFLAGVTVLKICSFSMFISTATFDHEDYCIVDHFQSALLPLIISRRAFAETKMSEKMAVSLLSSLYDHLLSQNKTKPKLKIIFPFHIFILLQLSEKFITIFRHQNI